MKKEAEEEEDEEGEEEAEEERKEGGGKKNSAPNCNVRGLGCSPPCRNPDGSRLQANVCGLKSWSGATQS